MPGYLHGAREQGTQVRRRFVCQAHVSVPVTADAHKMDEIQTELVTCTEEKD